MVTEDYVSFEIAKLLKEKGFDERCIMFYHNNELVPCVTLESVKENASCAINSWLYEGDYAAPTLQMAMKWVRENGWYIEIRRAINCFLYYYYVYDSKNLTQAYSFGYETYEKAAEEALKVTLDLL